jgi:hypothetical protein
MKSRNLDQTSHASAEILWTDQEAAWQQRINDDGDPVEDNGWPVGEASVEREIAVLDEQKAITRIEVWLGLFGGVPSRDQTGGEQKARNADILADEIGTGQIQEASITVYAAVPKSGGDYKKRVRLFERDRHQLTPSDSWEGTIGREVAVPIVCPAGTRIWYVCRTSQKDRGAHTRVSVELVNA